MRLQGHELIYLAEEISRKVSMFRLRHGFYSLLLSRSAVIQSSKGTRKERGGREFKDVYKGWGGKGLVMVKEVTTINK